MSGVLCSISPVGIYVEQYFKTRQSACLVPRGYLGPGNLFVTILNRNSIQGNLTYESRQILLRVFFLHVLNQLCGILSALRLD